MNRFTNFTIPKDVISISDAKGGVQTMNMLKPPHTTYANLHPNEPLQPVERKMTKKNANQNNNIP